MICLTCGSNEVIRIFEDREVRFECVNGHSWYEKYQEEGGAHERPCTFEYDFEDLLFPYEKEICHKLTEEILKHKREYLSEGLPEKIKAFIKGCDVKEGEADRLFDRIVCYNPKKVL